MAKGQKLTHQLLGTTLAFLLAGSCLIAPLSARAAENTITVPKLTEIYPNGPGSSESGTEFIEIANLGTSEIDLSNYQLKIKDKPTKVMNLSGTLAPQTYKAFITSYSLVNSGETVQLTHTTDGLIEEVAYTSGALENQSWSYFSEGWELTPITKDAASQRYEEEEPEEPEEPEVIDLCPATPEIDTVVPTGYTINEAGNCVESPAVPETPVESCAIEISEISAQPNLGDQEYVEFFNASSVVAHLKLCKIQINTANEKALPDTTLLPGGYYLYSVSSGTIRNSAGTVLLTRSDTQAFSHIYPATEAGQAVNFANGSLEGVITTVPTPGQPNQATPETEPEPEEPEVIDLCPATPEIDLVVPVGYVLNEGGVCVAVIPPVIISEKCFIEISEISAQPNFSGQEFIELHNASDTTAHLSLCKVKVNTATEKSLPDVTLAPGEYHVFAVSSGTVKNSAGMVTLVRSDGLSLQYSYPTTGSNQTVNFETGSLNGELSNQPTPGQPNEQMVTVVSEASATSDSLADCGPGRYRSPETNRCRNIESSESTLTPCAADQERNPETNRCRKIAAADAGLKPCEPGQERNPETNRCRKVESTDGLKPCDPGQERSPETNRCRKIATAVTGTPLEGSAKPAAINPFKYKTPVIVLVLLAAAGYGAYEYRTDLKNRYQKVRESIRRSRQ